MTSNEEQAIRQLLEPLRNEWPKIHLELCEAILAQYDPGRLGAILAAEFGKEIDSVKAEFGPNLPKLGEKETKFDYKVVDLVGENKRLQRKYEDIKIRIAAQNEEVANQYEQIKNLTRQSYQE